MVLFKKGHRSQEPESYSPRSISPTLGIWLSIFTLHCVPLFSACACCNIPLLETIKEVRVRINKCFQSNIEIFFCWIESNNTLSFQHGLFYYRYVKPSSLSSVPGHIRNLLNPSISSQRLDSTYREASSLNNSQSKEIYNNSRYPLLSA